MRRGVYRVLVTMGVLVVLAYPLVVYVGLSHFGAREVALVLLALASIALVNRLWGVDRAAVRGVLGPPLAVITVLALGSALDAPGFVLAVPALINLVLLATFARTLGGAGPPMIERFARLLVKDLDPAEVAYCRTVTIVWCAFFVVNGLTAGALALWAPIAWWAAFTGLVSYALMGALFGIEIVIRYRRFGRTGLPWLDRIMGRCFGREGRRP